MNCIIIRELLFYVLLKNRAKLQLKLPLLYEYYFTCTAGIQKYTHTVFDKRWGDWANVCFRVCGCEFGKAKRE